MSSKGKVLRELVAQALDKLGRSENLDEQMEYLEGEWMSSTEDLRLAIEDGQAWGDLKLPTRLKLALKAELQLLSRKDKQSTSGKSGPSKASDYSTPTAENKNKIAPDATDSGKIVDPVSPNTVLDFNKIKTVDEDVDVVASAPIISEESDESDEDLSERYKINTEGDETDEADSPLNWVKCFSPEHKSFYFFHETSGETKWELPPGVDITSIREDEWSSTAVEDLQAQATEPSAPEVSSINSTTTATTTAATATATTVTALGYSDADVVLAMPLSAAPVDAVLVRESALGWENSNSSTEYSTSEDDDSDYEEEKLGGREVDAELLVALQDMGFSRKVAMRSLVQNDNEISLATAACLRSQEEEEEGGKGKAQKNKKKSQTLKKRGSNALKAIGKMMGGK